ncbi:MAG: hypothetical protein HYX34_14365 [Actinobacteria bacterium]|nr:hypothetical protein [Actinomycetota bacterium]
MQDDDWDLADIYDPETVAAVESHTGDADDADPPFSSRLSRWSREAALGMVLHGFALGLQEVLDPVEKNQIVIEVDADGQPHDLPVQLFLDPDSPRGSLCVVHRDRLVPPVV